MSTSSPAPTRARLHPAAVVALATGGVIILGAIAFLVWLLTAGQTTPNAAATDKLVQWEQVFETYRDANSGLPDVAAGGYCLGTGFPVGAGGTPNCRDYDGNTFYTEEASAPLMQALATTGPLPEGVSAPVRGTVGPYAIVDDAGIHLLTAEDGTCEAPAVEVWNDGGGLFICQILLER
ncbi:hypothetical protein RWH43_09890 [Microbacterium sp. KSW2-21]|uniref:Uncharacterized protein n=1 Tax=Microbacterium algihabitans TaxID=3075992 RepID=A0ABU3RWU6_9MICO|nr:hypothetical protein [Microbacterium sp. KSW2-21]MDU0327065.1 hypothetical protein [Microbacterium sp. KSW2-21]